MVNTRSRKKPETWQRIAKERVQILFEQAERAFEKHPERSRRYIRLANKIGMRYNVRLEGAKMKYCRKCFALLKPGVNCRVRARKDRQAVVVACLECGSIYRHPYIREKKINKQRGEKR